jgi:Ca2+-binding RTX toxin-like protein
LSKSDQRALLFGRRTLVIAYARFRLLPGVGVVRTYSGQQDTTDGNDQVYGNRGKDWLLGYGGSDLLNGGHANDEIYAQDISTGNPGEDTVMGGGGNDSISANDGLFDTIDCGDGLDVVRYDTGLDEIENCEFQNP